MQDAAAKLHILRNPQQLLRLRPEYLQVLRPSRIPARNSNRTVVRRQASPEEDAIRLQISKGCRFKSSKTYLEL